MKICPTCSELFATEATFCPFDGTLLARSLDPLLGRTIAGRFRLVKRLGKGGTSSVYLARHVMIERLSAIKVLRQDLGMNPAHRERFLREARAVNRINHPNIVEITDYGEMEGLAYLVMEHVAGESLLAYLQRGVFPWERAAHVALQIASALGRAHEAGIVHRDLKPENVLLAKGDGASYASAPADRVKLTDFGIAKILDAPALTFSEQMFGTPGYIAPEYLDGLVPDGRADLYALGVVLYEMISGVLPYDARGQAELLFKPRTTPPVPLGKRIGGLPPEIESLVLRLLARERDDRPADAFVVCDALSEVLARRAGYVVGARGGGGGASGAPPRDQPLLAAKPARSSAAPAVERDIAPTLIDAPIPAEAPSAGAIETANIARLATSEMNSRWRSALEELERAVARASSGRTKEATRAKALGDRARELIAGVERATGRAADSQAKVDRLEAQAREFRANLGHAIDELGRDRARERAHLAALRARRDGAPASTEITLDDDSPPDAAGGRAWTHAALLAEEERAQAVERDLSFQIEALQKRLDGMNAEIEGDLIEHTAHLEGAIAATRRLTHELVRTLDEAAATLKE